MTDLRERFQQFDDVPVPELWERISELAAAEDPEPVPPATRQRLVTATAAALAVLIIVGLPILLLRGEEPAPVVGNWTSVPAEAPAPESIADMMAVPSGGFVALTADTGEVLWTPDAIEWFDADPDGQIGAAGGSVSTARFEPSTVAASNNRIVIMDQEDAGVWIGDRQTGVWRFATLADPAATGPTRLLTTAATADQVLVVGQQLGTDVARGTESELRLTDRFVAWVIDESTDDITRWDLPVPVPVAIDFVDADADSFAGHWLVVLSGAEWDGEDGWTGNDLILRFTPDGWVSSERPAGMGDITSISGGPSSAIITSCHFGGDSFWYTTDGVTWTQATNDFTGHLAEDVDGLGFVVHYGTNWYLSDDGSSWHQPSESGIAIEPYRDSGDIGAASEERVFEFDNRFWVWAQD